MFLQIEALCIGSSICSALKHEIAVVLADVSAVIAEALAG
jgi:hypothetical protein